MTQCYFEAGHNFECIVKATRMSKLYFVLLCCVLFTLLKRVTSLHCYECAYDGCGDPFKEENVRKKECRTTCFKSKTGTDVTRKCNPVKITESRCVKEKNGYEVCYCDKELCNKGAGPRVSVAAPVAVVIAVLKPIT